MPRWVQGSLKRWKMTTRNKSFWTQAQWMIRWDTQSSILHQKKDNKQDLDLAPAMRNTNLITFPKSTTWQWQMMNKTNQKEALMRKTISQFHIRTIWATTGSDPKISIKRKWMRTVMWVACLIWARWRESMMNTQQPRNMRLMNKEFWMTSIRWSEIVDNSYLKSKGQISILVWMWFLKMLQAIKQQRRRKRRKSRSSMEQMTWTISFKMKSIDFLVKRMILNLQSLAQTTMPTPINNTGP